MVQAYQNIMSKRALLQQGDIKDKALRQYPGFLSAWLSGTPFFPLPIPGIGAPDKSLAIAQQQVQSPDIQSTVVP